MIIDSGTQTSKSNSEKPTLSIDRISISLVGVERSNTRQHMFICLMTYLVDESHPPPSTMALPGQPIPDLLWEVIPSSTMVPFKLDLPVMLGPPPYKSKRNEIYYLISVLIEAKTDGKRAYARQSEEVIILPVHDRTSAGYASEMPWC